MKRILRVAKRKNSATSRRRTPLFVSVDPSALTEEMCRDISEAF